VNRHAGGLPSAKRWSCLKHCYMYFMINIQFVIVNWNLSVKWMWSWVAKLTAVLSCCLCASLVLLMAVCCRYCMWCHSWWRNAGTKLRLRACLRCAYAKLCRSLHLLTTARFRRVRTATWLSVFCCSIVLMCDVVFMCGGGCARHKHLIVWLHTGP